MEMALDNSSVSVGFECKPPTTQNVTTPHTQDDFSVHYSHKQSPTETIDNVNIKGDVWVKTEQVEATETKSETKSETLEDKVKQEEYISKRSYTNSSKNDEELHLDNFISEADGSKGFNSNGDLYDDNILKDGDFQSEEGREIYENVMDTDSSGSSCMETPELDISSEELITIEKEYISLDGVVDARKQEMGNLSNIDEEEEEAELEEDELEVELESFKEESETTDLAPEPDPRTVSAVSDLKGGRRAIPNTPSSLLADTMGDFKHTASRIVDMNSPSSMLTGDTTRACESREAIFRRALSLMSTRCTHEVSQNMGVSLIDVKEPPFGVHVPEYFHIHQNKPSPMAPLKAWRGYHGNVYFEPISIKSMQDDKDSKSPQQDWQGSAKDSRYQQTMSARNRKLRSSGRPSTTPPTRANTRLSLRSSARSRPQTRQTMLLDRHMLGQQEEEPFSEDMQDTGSLNVRSEVNEPPNNKRMYNKDRICKGSVAHRLKTEKEEQNKRNLLLKVSGDKFSPGLSMSPLLRTTTQYSYSNQRLTMNSPDPFHTGFEHLPPLEQVRVSLRHMDSLGDNSNYRAPPYGRKVTLTEELKPFIKYSPDVKARYKRQVEYLS